MCNVNTLRRKPIRGGSQAQFPGKLHDMLTYVEDQGLESIISWTRQGRSFMVHNPDTLVQILPIFFEQTKYRSFRRQLNMWHFERILDGPNKGGFSHPFFIKGNKPLCAHMSREAKPTLRHPNPLPPSLFETPSSSQIELPLKIRSKESLYAAVTRDLPPQPTAESFSDGDQVDFAGRHFFFVDCNYPSSKKMTLPDESLKRQAAYDETLRFIDAPVTPRLPLTTPTTQDQSSLIKSFWSDLEEKKRVLRC